MKPTLVLCLLLFPLAGCATGTRDGLSSLSYEVQALPLRGQTPEQIKQDDIACEAWTRATKGKDEPLPSAELRYAACAIARGYQADVCCIPESAFGGTVGGTRYHVPPAPRSARSRLCWRIGRPAAWTRRSSIRGLQPPTRTLPEAVKP